jgi:hypothetical protein
MVGQRPIVLPARRSGVSSARKAAIVGIVFTPYPISTSNPTSNVGADMVILEVEM